MILTPDNEYSAVLDACVLYPMPLCDTLLRLAEEPAFYRPLWSEMILAELGSTMLSHGKTPAQRDRRVGVMREYFPEALVETPATIIKAVSVELPDVSDAHVLAAAIVSKANAIVTQNTRHFPKDCLERYGILCQNADDFLVHQYYLGPEKILEKLDYQAALLRDERATLVQNLAKITPKFSGLIRSGVL